VARKVRKVLFPSPASVARELGHSSGLNVSVTTVRNDVAASGLKCYSRPKVPLLSEADRPARKTFVRAQIRRPKRELESLLFSDEKWFDSDDHGSRVMYCPRGQQKQHLIPREMSQSRAKVFVWGCIGVGRRFIKVVQYDGKGMTADDYLRECIVPARHILRNRELMQDGATCHWTESVTQKLEQYRCKLLEKWPPHSPDLNPIEHVWHIVARAVSERGPWSCEDLATFVVEEFNKVPEEVIDKLVLSFFSRCKEVSKAEGGPLV
jgi:hypothetical protein